MDISRYKKSSAAEMIPRGDSHGEFSSAPIISERGITVAAFLLYCFSAAAGDLFNEWVFKNPSHRLSPQATLLIYSVFTVAAALGYMAWIGGRPFRVLRFISSHSRIRRDALLTGLLTCASFMFYFFAVESPLGAGLSSFADFSITPVATSLFAVLFLAERLDRGFWQTLILCLVGQSLLLLPRLHWDGHVSSWINGASFLFASSLAGSLSRVFNKKLLGNRLDRTLALAIRFLPSIPILSLYCVWSGEPWQGSAIGMVSLATPFVFMFPIFLYNFSLSRMNIKNFSLLLFLVPLLTYFVSVALSRVRPVVTDLPAAALILAGLIGHSARHSTRHSTTVTTNPVAASKS